MNKRAIIYTTAAIALTIVIFITYSAYTTSRLNERMSPVQTRIETVNFFIKDVEKDLSKGIYIAGYRAMLSLNQHITTNGTYLDDVNLRFKEAFMNGTIKNISYLLMQDSTFTDWANKISAEADKVDVLFNYTINEVKVNQSNPWAVDIGVNITLEISDKRNTSYWIREKYLETKVSIIDFEDPLYIVNSGGRVTSTIRISPISTFVNNGNVLNLLIHTNSSYYIVHNDSPSFLMRLEGNVDNSSLGIESLVNLDKFIAQGLPLKDKSIVDSVYFGNRSAVNHRINSTPEWFKIDQDHLETYQVEDITI